MNSKNVDKRLIVCIYDIIKDYEEHEIEQIKNVIINKIKEGYKF